MAEMEVDPSPSTREYDPKTLGFALVVSCEETKVNQGVKKLLGVNKDEEKLKDTFTKLRFATESLHNPSRDEIEKRICEIAGSEFPECYKRFVFTFSGHGSDTEIYVADDKVAISELVERFQPNNCSPTLAPVPKLFFIDACRGKCFNEQIRYRGAEECKPIKTPSNGNVLVARSTMRHFLARETQDGGLWTSILVDKLLTRDASIEVILREVRKELVDTSAVETEANLEHVHVQVSEDSSSLTEEVNLLKESRQLDNDPEDVPETNSDQAAVPVSKMPPPTVTVRDPKEASVHARGNELLHTRFEMFCEKHQLKPRESYIQDFRRGQPLHKCKMEFLIKGAHETIDSSGYHPSQVLAQEAVMATALGKWDTYRPTARGGGGSACGGVGPTQRKQDPQSDTAKLQQRIPGGKIRYKLKQSRSGFQATAIVPTVGIMHGDVCPTQSEAKNSAAHKALQALEC